MKKNLTKKQYWDLFQKLPSKIKTVILSEETAIEIFDICNRNDVDMNEISQVASFIGQTLLGALPPKSLGQTLSEELTLKKAQAKRIALEAEKTIFAQLQPSLNEIYETGTIRDGCN